MSKSITVQLSSHQLGVEMKKFAQNGHYGAAYKYLSENIPKVIIMETYLHILKRKLH